MKYDYRKHIKEDIINYIKDNYTKEEINEKSYDEFYDDLFIEDSVTGNASGSYTFNTWQAEENLTHNYDLLTEALDEFGYTHGSEPFNKGAEWCDVTIRCYLLGECLTDALSVIQED